MVSGLGINLVPEKAAKGMVCRAVAGDECHRDRELGWDAGNRGKVRRRPNRNIRSAARFSAEFMCGGSDVEITRLVLPCNPRC